MAKLSHLVAASFSSLALLSSSVSMANLRFLFQLFYCINFYLHVQRERGKVIGVGVHIYVCGPKNMFEVYVSDQLTLVKHLQ